MVVPPPGISKKEILKYLRLEESEETVELLKISSLLYVGYDQSFQPPTHYWSYPTEDGIGWVSMDATGCLGTVYEAPADIERETLSREAHPKRSGNVAEAIQVDRSTRSEPIWIPWKQVPVLHFYPVWHENTSFDAALAHFRARAKTAKYSRGVERTICLHLKSGRFAILSCNENFPSTIEFSLELQGRESPNSIGFVYSQDMREIFERLGLQFEKPSYATEPRWR